MAELNSIKAGGNIADGIATWWARGSPCNGRCAVKHGSHSRRSLTKTDAAGLFRLLFAAVCIMIGETARTAVPRV